MFKFNRIFFFRFNISKKGFSDPGFFPGKLIHLCFVFWHIHGGKICFIFLLPKSVKHMYKVIQNSVLLFFVCFFFRYCCSILFLFLSRTGIRRQRVCLGCVCGCAWFVLLTLLWFYLFTCMICFIVSGSHLRFVCLYFSVFFCCCLLLLFVTDTQEKI